MTACAAAVSGGFIGFLFGIPRALAANAASDGRRGYGGNTNLEQISDWLTKILLGASLTQLGTLRSAGGDLVRALAPSFGVDGSAAPFAATLVVYFVVVGFLGGWLLTRLFLGAALTAADDDAVVALQAAAAAEAAGDAERASELRGKAVRLIEAARSAADVYSQIRAATPASWERTVQLEEVAAAGRRAATDATMDLAAVRAIYDRGGEGDRVYALGVMQGNASVADVDRLVTSIEHSQSAFEQYHALRATQVAAPSLDDASRARIAAAVTAQRSDSGWIKRDSDRWPLSESVLAALEAPR